MFNKLIASAPDHRRWLRNPTVIFVSVAAHLLMLAGIVWASTRPPEEPAPEPERIAYIDITEIPPPPEPDPEEVFEAAPEPVEAPPVQQAPPPRAATPPAPRTPTPPAAPPRAPATPRNPQPSTTPTEQPGGFQELTVPDLDVSGIPPPNVSAPAVRAEDFGGRGAPGGTASGAAPAPLPTPTRTPAAAGRAGGTGTGTGSGTGAGAGGEGGTFTANLVDDPAQLLNANEVARVLARRYPQRLEADRVEGRVVVQFVVDRNGRVESATVRVLSATHDEFVEPTRTALQEFRFKPGRRQGQTVRQVVQLPIAWVLPR
jgi:TonB family protein